MNDPRWTLLPSKHDACASGCAHDGEAGAARDGHDHAGHRHAGHDHDAHAGHDHAGHDHGAHDDHDHDHGGIGHVHAHGDGPNALRTALLLNGAFLVIELGVGLWSGSLALLSDAAHMVSDVGALLVAIGAARLAARPPSAAATFGWRRAEVLGAAVNGLTLLLATAWIVAEAVERFRFGPPDVPGLPILVVGVVGLLINLWSAWALWRGGDDLNLRAAFAHMVADALGSAAAVLAAVGVLLGYPIADPALSVLVAILVGAGGLDLLRQAGSILLQLPPAGFNVDAARSALLALPGVTGLHDLRVWSLDGRTPILSAHLVADAEPELVRRRADAALHRLGVHDLTLQIEPAAELCCRQVGHPSA